MSTTCGSTNTTTGKTCAFPSAENCPHHPGPSPAGRKSKYDPETGAFVCEQIAQGRSLREVCRHDPDLPHASTIVRWAQADRDGFAQQYARACQIRLDVLAEELLEISDDGRNDTYVDEDGHEHTNYDVIQRSKLRVDTRKWLLSKLRPEKYGRRQRVEHSGPDGGPIETKSEVDLTRLSTEDLKLLKQLRKRAHVAGNGASG